MTPLLPCKRCGSTKIELWDCGYSSFNPGGGRCENGHEAKNQFLGASPTQKELADVWNGGQALTETEKLRTESERLRSALRALYDAQNGPPLIRDADAWRAAMDEAEALLKSDQSNEVTS